MSKFKIIQREGKIFFLLCLVVIIKLVNAACPFPYERCICTGATPLCPCTQLTSTQNLNISSTYYSHLVLVTNYGCRTCPPRCRKCSATQVCTDCFDEFELVGNYCVSCPINCKQCKSGVCQSCIDGYYIDYQLKCQLCPLVGTKTCTIDSLLSCLSNYWMDNNGATCINCDLNCVTCSSTTKCSACSDGYYELNYVCYSCRNDCATCTNGTSCLTCLSSGYFFNSTSSMCIQCPGSNCLACNSNGTCTQCDTTNNYYLDKTMKQCYKYSNSTAVSNCKNLTFTTSTNTFACQNCQDGYYSQSDYTNASLLTCFYTCSITCSQCTGPHYGLCNSCISTDFNLWNRNCIPKYNVNGGSAFQLLYTALNNVSFFQAPNLILPDSCWHQYVKGGSSTLTFRLSNMASYKFTLKWKIYKYNFFNNNQTDGTYSLHINNTNIQNGNLSQGYSLISLNCINKIGFSSLCTSGSSYQCTDKNSIDFDSLITVTDNVFTFSSSNSLLAMSELLVIGYRCGGLYGDGCSQCSDINTCTKCYNPAYYLIAEQCISQCPNTYYTYEEFKKCVEICPSGSYSDDVLHQCFSCQSPCETCTSNILCLTCLSGFFYDMLSDQCKTSCPKLYYPDSYRKICEQCSNPCLQCLDSVKCVSCRQGFLNILNQTVQSSDNSTVLYGECVLQCPDGMYTDLLTMRCQSCMSPCKTCSLLANQCMSCLTSYYLLDYSCLIQCPQGYYENQTLSKCSQCDSSCKNCLNLTFCAECSVGFYLNFDNTCVTSCIVGYYQEQVLKQCLKCKVNCTSCNSYDICTSCATNFSYLEDNYSCVGSCPKFYYPINVVSNNSLNQSICQRCQLPCYQCSSQTTCLSCYDAFLFNGSCLIVCPYGYFANLANLQCSLCDNNSCLQCKNTATQCTECHENLLLVNGECLASCPYGFYFSTYYSQCVLCEGLCDTCLNSTYCLSCVQGFSIWGGGQCVDSCQTGFYQQQNISSGTFTCTQCPSQCQSCIYNNTVESVQCLLCSLGYSFYNGSCLINCPEGYYNDSGQCMVCLSPCSKCRDSEYCFQCLDNNGFLYEGTCVTSCPYGYYSSQKQCLSCDASCLLCTGNATNCLACNGNLYMYSFYLNNFTNSQSICSDSCPIGYFKDQSSSNYDSLCQKCSLNCKTCNDSLDKCTSCPQGKILYNYKCMTQCPLNTYLNLTSNTCIICSSNCLYCLNNTTCIQCSGEYFLASNNSCLKSCSINQYGQDGICKPCVYPCKSCISESQCLSCIVGIYYVSENSCMDTCPQGSFYVNQNGTEYCQPCKVNCSRCISLNQCLFCDNGLSLYIGSCLEQCPDGYYVNYGYCLQCDQNCGKCLNSYTCLECVNGSYLLNNKCSSYCPVGYFAANVTLNQSNLTSIQSICEPCATQCTTCFKSSTQCTQCSSGYYLYINSCLLSCPSGSYSSSTLQTCQPCVSPCQTCTNAYSCETCIYGYLLYREYSRNQCVQGPSCPNNYYLNTDLNICQFVCPQNYYVSQSTMTCSLSCPNNLVTLASNMSCLEYCPQNMWIDQNLYCQSSSPPSNLPYLSCSSFIVRNLLFLNCIITNAVNNLNSLTAQNILMSIGNVTLIKIKSASELYVLVTGVNRILRNEQITLQLVNRYELRSSLQVNTTSRLLTSQSQTSQKILVQSQSNNSSYLSSSSSSTTVEYPVQNYNVQILISQYIPYSVSQREIGLNFYQIGQSISYAALILWLFCLLKNVKILSLVFIISIQWLYSLSMLLSDNFLAPNVKQFLQGFKYSALIDFISIWSYGNDSASIWVVNNFLKPQFWAINNLYSVQQSLITVYVIISVFLFIFLFTFALSRFFNENHFSQQYQNLLKIGKKSQLINERFFSNYFLQLLLLIICPISLIVNIQFTEPNVQGLIQSIILILFYLIVIGLSIYYFIKWKGENVQKNKQKSMLFFYLSFGTIVLNSIFVVWSTFYLYIGFSVASIVFNMIVWHIIYRHIQSKRCSYLQLIELFKGFILIVLIIGDIKRQKWSSDEMFYFGFVQIIIIFFYILLSSVFIAQQLFRPQQQTSSKKHQKPLQQSLLKQKSYKTQNFPKHYKQQKDHGNQSQSKQSQEIIQQEEQSQLSFFSNKTPLSDSDDQSSGDIIDFDESQQHNGQSSSNKIKMPPKNLFKYDKNA